MGKLYRLDSDQLADTLFWHKSSMSLHAGLAASKLLEVTEVYRTDAWGYAARCLLTRPVLSEYQVSRALLRLEGELGMSLYSFTGHDEEEEEEELDTEDEPDDIY